MSRRRDDKGFTLIEVVVVLGIFSIIATGIYLSYANVLEIIQRTGDKSLARALLDREIESLRSLDYGQIGIEGGYPAGILPASRDINYEGKLFAIAAFVRNIDDSFDGVTGGNPNDTAPADYKLVELRITCSNCLNFKETSLTTWVSPEGLETVSNNGSLFINVFDASGQAVSGADITVINNALNPAISINDSSDVNGKLKLVDIPPSVNGYEVYVSKDGYSSAQTYELNEPNNPNPIQPHATVATQSITEISLAIDRVSTINVSTKDFFCSTVNDVSFDQTGTILIGSGPDVPRYSALFSTDANGDAVLNDIPWDTYSFTNQDSNYDFAGVTPIIPLVVNPNTTHNLSFSLLPNVGNALLLEVLDESTGQIISGSAQVNLSKAGFSDNRLTGEWYLDQTDWSGNNYFSQDGNIESEAVIGEISLLQTGGVYPTSTNSWLISKIFDFGTSSTTFNKIVWTSVEPIGVGNNAVRFQLASNNNLTNWIYIGPDGTSATYYLTSGTGIGIYHDGNRYFRYKVFLNTALDSLTPILKDVRFDFSSGCVPMAQVFWPNLSTGVYNITVTKANYNTVTSTVDVNSTWQKKVIDMIAL